MEHLETIPIKCSANLTSNEFDAVILITDDVASITGPMASLSACVTEYKKLFSESISGVHTLRCDALDSKKLIVSFTEKLNRDYDDIRRITDATKAGMMSALESGSKKPLLVLTPLGSVAKLNLEWTKQKSLCLATLLSALYTLYVPLEVREFTSHPAAKAKTSVKARKVDVLYWFSGSFPEVNHEEMVTIAWALEEGRRVARDIGGSDPERMCARRICDYLKAELKTDEIKMTINPVDPQQYPLAAVVDRGSNANHKGSIVHLEYSGPKDQNAGSVGVTDLYLVGKGITYDTGGSDLKVGGIMVTMHRDKCGAAAVAGFFKTASILKPKNINLHGSLALVRNSIGENAYVSDEIITSRAGVRVRVNNTDAEGRMVMTDLLCEAKEQAAKVPKPLLVTIATLTGHVLATYGSNYTGIVCNGPAHSLNADFAFQEVGFLLGEMHEISRLRREDYDVHKTKEPYADLLNSQNPAQPGGGKRHRGHQSPAAFMIIASGLDAHMLNTEKPLPYTHFDIAGSQGPVPGVPSAVPILTLASEFLIPDYFTGLIQNRL